MLDTRLNFTIEEIIQVYLNRFQQFLQGTISSRQERIGRQETIELLLRSHAPESVANCLVDALFKRLDTPASGWLFVEDVKQEIPHLDKTIRNLVGQLVEGFTHTFQQALQMADSHPDGTIDHHELINVFMAANCMPHHIAEQITNEMLYNIEMNGSGRIPLEEIWEQILTVADRCINARAIVEQIVKTFTRNFNYTLQSEGDGDRKLKREELVKAISRSFRNAPRYYAEQMANDMFVRLGQNRDGEIPLPEIYAQIPQMQSHLVVAADYVTRTLMDTFQAIVRESACNRSGTIARRELLNCLIRAGMSPYDANCTADDIFASFDRDPHQYLSLQEVLLELPNQGWRCIYPLR
ncbi:MAG: hypothetical protein J7647_04580 [Cyanobacteria bacterium SBLK]|nr:hypothetical protein [Cyanobacteria bacterium SBLK]